MTKKILFDKETIESKKTELVVLKDELNPIVDKVILSMEQIPNNWKGKKASEKLKTLEIRKTDLKNKVINTLNENITYLDGVIQTMMKTETTEVEAIKEESKPDTFIVPPPTGTQEEVYIVPPSTSETVLDTYSSSSIVSSKTYTKEYMNSVIEDLKQGISPFSKENMPELSLNYNQNGTVRDLGYDYFKESETALANLQEKLKTEKDTNGNILWGTPAATQAVMHFMVKTGFKIPTFPTKKTDTVGNYRYIGLNPGWLDNSNGLDCNNFSAWLNINSGRMPENKHFYTQPQTSNSIKLYVPSTINSPTGGEAGDLLARSDHVASYMYEDENYIYAIEAVNVRKGAVPGSLITVLPKDGKSTNLNPTTVLYPTTHLNYIVKEKDIQIVDNPASEFI